MMVMLKGLAAAESKPYVYTDVKKKQIWRAIFSEYPFYPV